MRRARQATSTAILVSAAAILAAIGPEARIAPARGMTARPDSGEPHLVDTGPGFAAADPLSVAIRAGGWLGLVAAVLAAWWCVRLRREIYRIHDAIPAGDGGSATRGRDLSTVLERIRKAVETTRESRERSDRAPGDRAGKADTPSDEMEEARRERDLLEAQLRQAQKLESIGQLAAGIAHEINTPTQYVGDNTRFIRDSLKELLPVGRALREILDARDRGDLGEEHFDAARAAIDAADLDFLEEELPNAVQQSLEGIERVSEIVRAMKSFSHPGTTEKKPYDINEAIRTTITVSRNEWKYVADVETDLAADLPLVPCLPGEFNQVILNMIVNAAHAIADVVGESGEKGTIGISTRVQGNHARIEVRDTGCGIPEDIRSRIFDPFFTTKEVGKGTGQGLAIAHSVVVQKHGGQIEVASEEGQGTTFTLLLPLDPNTASKPSSTAPAAQPVLRA